MNIENNNNNHERLVLTRVLNGEDGIAAEVAGGVVGPLKPLPVGVEGKGGVGRQGVG